MLACPNVIKVGFDPMALRFDVIIQQIGSLSLLCFRRDGPVGVSVVGKINPQSLGKWKKRLWKIGHIFLVEWLRKPTRAGGGRDDAGRQSAAGVCGLWGLKTPPPRFFSSPAMRNCALVG